MCSSDLGHRGRHRRANRVGCDRDLRPRSGATFSVVQHDTHHSAGFHWREPANFTADLHTDRSIGVHSGAYRTDSGDHTCSPIGSHAGAYQRSHAGSKAAPSNCCDGRLQPSFRALTQGQVSVSQVVSPN